MSVDIIKYEKEIKKWNGIKDFLLILKNNDMEFLSLLAIQALDEAKIYHTPSIITYSLGGYLLYKCMKEMDYIENLEKKRNEMVLDKIKETDTYKQIEELYDKYLDDLAVFYKEVGQSSTKDSTLLYDFMIRHGYFSKKHMNFYDYNIIKFRNCRKIRNREIDDIKGVAVLTGKSVCRHNAKLFYDLECKLGNKSYIVTTHSDFDLSKLHKKSKIRNLKSDHLINVLVDDNNEAWAYCPTNNTYLDYEIVNDKDIIFRNLAFQNPKYMYSKYNERNDEKNIYNIDELYNGNIKPKKFDIRDAAILFIHDSYDLLDELKEFYNKEESTINKLSDLYETIIPREVLDTKQKQKKLIL